MKSLIKSSLVRLKAFSDVARLTRPVLTLTVLSALATACGMPDPLHPFAKRSVPPTASSQDTHEAPPAVQHVPAAWRGLQAWPDESVGFLRQTYRSIEPNQAKALVAALLKQATHRDRIDFVPHAINQAPMCSFTQPVEGPEEGVVHTDSILMRLLQLTSDADGLPLCNAEVRVAGHTYRECDLFRIDNLADFYLRAIAHEAYLTVHLSEDHFVGRHAANPGSWLSWAVGSPMEALTGIDGIEPTDHVADSACLRPGQNCLTYSVSAPAANRLLFGTFDTTQDGTFLPSGTERTRSLMARPIVRGVPFDVLHGGTLSAWECDDFLALIQPAMATFVHHDKMDLLLATLRLVHLYAEADPKGLHEVATDLFGIK